MLIELAQDDAALQQVSNGLPAVVECVAGLVAPYEGLLLSRL
jgi:hypothetical protein